MQIDYSIFSRFRGFQLLAGFSGGADSTALLLSASRAAKLYDLDLIAVHFNHHLRGAESDKEALDAGKFAAALGVEFICCDLEIAPGGNLESRARAARLAKWKELCAGYENPVVLLGHHQDDRIENLFLRLGRGSNVSGLSGMQRSAGVEGVKFFRPLWDFSRQEIEEFLQANGVSRWAVDSSNSSCDFSRNALRNKILPEFFQLCPGGRKAVTASLKNLECDADFLDETARRCYAEAADRFSVVFWQNQHPALVVRMLRLLCREFFGGDQPLSGSAVERFAAMVTENRSGICLLEEERRIVFSGGRLSPWQETLPPVRWEFRKEREIWWGKWRFTAAQTDHLPENCPLFTAYFDAERLPDVLEIGAPENGEVMLPFGRKNPVKVKELRIKRKIPSFPANPLLRDDKKKVIWLPGIRHSGEYPVRSGTQIVMICGEKMKDFS